MRAFLVATAIAGLGLVPAAAEGRCETSWPAPRWGHSLVYDGGHEVVLLFGGATARRAFIDDTWSWDGERWTCHDVEAPPAARAFAGAAWDARTGQVVIHGGRGEGNVTLRDTWGWDGEAWRRLATEGPRIDHHGVAPDPTGGLIAFGGWNGGAVVSATWRWDGERWQELAVSGPPKRSAFAMAHDPAQRRVVIHGGLWIEGQYADAWSWNGKGWRALSGPYDNSSVDHHAMVFDPRRSLLLLFGGKNYRYRMSASTRTLEAGRVERLDVEGPAARHSTGFVFDERRARAMLFGGKIYAGEEQLPLGDLWFLDASGWVEERPPQP